MINQRLVKLTAHSTARSKANCCLNQGNNWDEAILYAPTFKWSDKPIPAFWNGPVVKTITG